MKYVVSGFSRTGRVVFSVAACLLLSILPVWAQLAAPNAAGVSMGYLHFRVKDVDATRKFWLALGGRAPKPTSSPALRSDITAIVLPDVIILLSPGTPTAGSGTASAIDHVAFRVRSFAEVEAAGFTVNRLQQFPGVGSITTPDGERIELFENSATNLTFTPDAGPVDPVAARHNRPLSGKIAFHHIHLYVPPADIPVAKAWYARVFGGTPGKRSNYDAVDLPGVNINISAPPKAGGTTIGRSLAGIGFEVQDKSAFVERLLKTAWADDLLPPQAPPRPPNGRQPVLVREPGFEAEALTDPWGIDIGWTQGWTQW